MIWCVVLTNTTDVYVDSFLIILSLVRIICINYPGLNISWLNDYEIHPRESDLQNHLCKTLTLTIIFGLINSDEKLMNFLPINL